MLVCQQLLRRDCHTASFNHETMAYVIDIFLMFLNYSIPITKLSFNESN